MINNNAIHVRELIGWSLDEYEYRPSALTAVHLSEARQQIALREPFTQRDAILEKETSALQDSFQPHTQRVDLLAEMAGLDWSVGVVDLRYLLAFQRRLSFPSDFSRPIIPMPRDWSALLAVSFGPSKAPECEVFREPANNALVLRSANPNLQLRFTNDTVAPLAVHTGSPFFEVACFHNRWFLRDGYHRAYTLMQAGIFEVPAVVVYARTLEELGATQSWFFPQDILFSDHPPYVSDFLKDDLVLEYKRPALIKTLRITTEDILAPASSTGELL